MCLAIPGQIKELDGEHRSLATVEVSGVRRKVNVDLLAAEGIEVGDWVLVHVGFALSKVAAEEAAEQMRLLALLGEEEEALAELEGYRFDSP